MEEFRELFLGSDESTGYLTLGAMGDPLPRLGNRFRVAAPANTYVCRNGRIMAGVLLDTHWRRLASLLGRPELGEDPRYATALVFDRYNQNCPY